jgi:NAD(P)-dependent dehydrogenase (short-subunit alcohol dehydrogenase family)
MARVLGVRGDLAAGLDIDADNFHRSDPNLHFHTCDVTDPMRAEHVVEDVPRLTGKLDILVNNAFLARFEPFVERDVDETRRGLEANFLGYVNAVRAVLPVMLRQGAGMIHNASSGVGYTRCPGIVGCTSSKGAIESLTRTPSLELADAGTSVSIIHR